MSAQSEIAESRFGGRLQEFYLAPEVTTVSRVLIPPDAERVSLAIVNVGATVAWLRLSRPGAAGIGFRLSASGGGVSFSIDEDPLLIGLAMYLITPAGTTDLDIFGARRISST